MRRAAALVLTLALAVGLVSCASPRQDRSPLPSATQTARPAGTGPGLRELGFENGPSNVALPDGIVLEPSVDQPNVVTVFFNEPTPTVALARLRPSLQAAGFTITADGGGSLVFEGPEWTGGYTATGSLSALTFRRR